MSSMPSADWDPRSPAVLADQRRAYDRMRERCPVAHSDYLQWSVFRHADVVRILHDHATFSSQASSHLSVPNSMDPPEHSAYRAIIERYFTAERMSAFEPVCRAIADELAAVALSGEEVELMGSFAQPFALRIQCAFMGWPLSLQEPLLSWATRNSQATLQRDRTALAALAAEFEELVAGLLAQRRSTEGPAPGVTSELMNERVHGRPLSDGEMASILRNWTVGEIGTIAASVGIIGEFLASHPQVQQQLRDDPSLLWKANDEILRIHGPLVDNRRRTTCPVQIGERQLAADQRVTINWISANRDPDVFADPDQFSLERDPSLNLLYGAGVHVCPGAPLARMELVIIIGKLLEHTSQLALIEDQPPTLASYPSSGFASLPLRLGRR